MDDAERRAVLVAAPVDVIEPGRHARRHGDPELVGQPVARARRLHQHPARVAAVHVLDGEEVLRVVAADAEHPGDVLVVERRQHPGLFEEHLDALLGGAHRRRQQLEHAIGIDLGTTHSLVAYTVDGRPECVLDCDMSPLLPSVVHYLEHGGVMVGNAGKEKAALHPRETLVSVKRFMGRGADDAETRRMGPYDFAMPEAGQSNTVRFKVHGRTLTPVEVSAEILRVLRTNAEEKLRTIGGAVITVPAYFDEAQRQATKDAAKLAGLEVLRLLNEPTAAALAYGLDKGRTRGTFAVYDLGGGTFDVTILSLDDGVFQVRSTGGDAQLGGDDRPAA
jgi:molecular chaperone DnaK (HSP70)